MTLLPDSIGCDQATGRTGTAAVMATVATSNAATAEKTTRWAEARVADMVRFPWLMTPACPGHAKGFASRVPN